MFFVQHRSIWAFHFMMKYSTTLEILIVAYVESLYLFELRRLPQPPVEALATVEKCARQIYAY